MAETLIHDDDQCRIWEERTAVGVNTRYEAKAGSPAANIATLQQRAAAALATNNTYVNIASPTTAQAVAQVKVLTKENTAVIRLLLGLLDDITGT